MSKLDQIRIRANSVTPERVDDDYYYRLDDASKQQIKDLMLELIGDTELLKPNQPGFNLDVAARNGLRDELRQKVNGL